MTPGPFKFKVSSQGQGRTPRVSGIENPATSYKENKAVLLRHTPFAERCGLPVGWGPRSLSGGLQSCAASHHGNIQHDTWQVKGGALTLVVLVT